jgi:hypothetical protein
MRKGMLAILVILALWLVVTWDEAAPSTPKLLPGTLDPSFGTGGKVMTDFRI